MPRPGSDRELVKPYKGKDQAITSGESARYLKSMQKYTNCKMCGKELKDPDSKQSGLCPVCEDKTEGRTDKFRITKVTESQGEF